MSSSITARQLINDNAKTLEYFVTEYLFDEGVQIQIVEVVTKDLFGQSVASGGIIPAKTMLLPQKLVSQALRNIVKMGLTSDTVYSQEKLIEGAASFEFLVRHANMLPDDIIPSSVKPSREVINAALALFHNTKQRKPELQLV